MGEMSEDIQGLLDKINREGVEKARAEADRIVAEARAQAEKIVSDANNEAARAIAEAERSAKTYMEGANATVQQAMRDILAGAERSIQDKLQKLLAKDVDRALADEKTVLEIVSAAVKEIASKGEISAPSRVVDMLKAQLASLGSFTLVTDESVGSGFSVKVEDGRVEHDFTGKAISEELSRHLRPDLAALLK